MINEQQKIKKTVGKSIYTTLLLFSFALLTACETTGPSPSVTNKQVMTKSDKALIHAQLARGYMQQKQYSIAKNELDKALSINSKHSDSNYVMGLLMLELEQYELAEEHLVKAVKSNSENSSAAHDLGVFLCQIGKEREAVVYFEIAASNPLFGKSELSYMRAGECLSNIGDDRAELFLKRALSVNSKLPPALYRLAIMKNEQGSYMTARAYIERYMAVTKMQPGALYLAYTIESKLNASVVAEKYRQKILENFPGSEQASKLRILGNRSD